MELVCPNKEPRAQPQMRRIIVAGASLVALAGCAAVAVQQSGSSGASSLSSAQLSFGDAAFHGAAPAAVREGSVRGNNVPKFTPPGGAIDEYGLKGKKQTLAQVPAKQQQLAFGDAKVGKDMDAAGREGGVRNGVKPDFQKPLGDLGEVGLAKKATSGLKPAAMMTKTQSLAFGDAKVVKDVDAAAREGSVRHGVKPDFVKPLGGLGESGLAAKPLIKQQQLAFGDAAFHKSTPASAREGSVRGNVKPDFSKPLGDLGETGLAAVKPNGGKKLSAAAARNAMDEYYAQQAQSLKQRSAPELTAKAAVSQLSSYFSKITTKDAQEHNVELEKAIKDEKAQRGTVSSYYTKLQAKDKQLHAAAVAKEHTQVCRLADVSIHHGVVWYVLCIHSDSRKTQRV